MAENLKGVVDEILSIIPNERALEKLVNLNKYGELTDLGKGIPQPLKIGNKQRKKER